MNFVLLFRQLWLGNRPPVFGRSNTRPLQGRECLSTHGPRRGRGHVIGAALFLTPGGAYTSSLPSSGAGPALASTPREGISDPSGPV